MADETAMLDGVSQAAAVLRVSGREKGGGGWVLSSSRAAGLLLLLPLPPFDE